MAAHELTMFLFLYKLMFKKVSEFFTWHQKLDTKSVEV